MTYTNIPNAMKAFPNWIFWRLEDQGREKPVKVAYSVNGNRAKTNDASTWATFDEALAVFERGTYNGLGFVFTGTPFIGVDIDGCIDSESDDFSAEALDVVRKLNSYTEFSQSGKGLQIIIKGLLPSGRRRNGALANQATTSSDNRR